MSEKGRSGRPKADVLPFTLLGAASPAPPQHAAAEMMRDDTAGSTRRLVADANADGAASDITSREQAEQALKESEACHRALFDAIDEGLCLFERLPLRADGLRDYRYLAMNPAMQAMFGVADLTGQSIRDNFPDEVEAWYDDYDRVLQTGEPIRLVRESSPQGMVLEMFVTRLEDDSGRRLLAVMRDVTQRKRAEQRQQYLLKLSDALRPLIDPGAIQEAACRVLGEHLGVDWTQYGELDLDREVIAIAHDGYRRGQRLDEPPSVVGEYRLEGYRAHAEAWRAGRSLAVHDAERDAALSESERSGMQQNGVRAALSTPLVKDGVPVVIMAAASSVPRQWMAKDVALLEETAERTWTAVERGRAEAALRESEERTRRAHDLLRGITEATDDMVVALDTDFRFIAFNSAYQAAFERVFGRRIQVGTCLIDALAHLPDDQKRAVDLWRRALMGETVCETQEFGDPRRARRFFDLRFGPIRDASGEIIGAGEFANDVTERVQHERALREAKHELEEADRRKDEFLAMLGHELRNPLAAIRNATELVKLIAPADGPLQRASAVLDRQSTHMTRLIDGLLEVSRIARGKIQLDRETLDARDVVQGVLQDRRPQGDARGLRLRDDLPREPVWIHADRVRMAQVLDNLLGNAIKFTEAGGSIHVTLRTDGGQAVFRVRDTGIGIRAETVHRLFEPFQQERQELARSAGGLGLGLAVAKGLVQLHDGTIEADSAGLGAGAEFLVRLPLAARPAAQRSRARPTEAGRRRILVVEDNPDAGQSLRDLLETLGHDVDVVESGPEALQVLSRQGADVVFCDIGLPGMSGYEVARSVRSTASLAGVRLVAVTGYGQPNDRRKTDEAGFDDHLTKPVDIDKLNQALQYV